MSGMAATSRLTAGGRCVLLLLVHAPSVYGFSAIPAMARTTIRLGLCASAQGSERAFMAQGASRRKGAAFVPEMKDDKVSDQMRERLTKENRQPLRLPLLLGSGVVAGKALTDMIASAMKAAAGMPEDTMNWGGGLSMTVIDIVCIILGSAGVFIAYTMDEKRNMWEGPWKNPNTVIKPSELSTLTPEGTQARLGSAKGGAGAMIVAGPERAVCAVVAQVADAGEGVLGDVAVVPVVVGPNGGLDAEATRGAVEGKGTAERWGLPSDPGMWGKYLSVERARAAAQSLDVTKVALLFVIDGSGSVVEKGFAGEEGVPDLAEAVQKLRTPV